MGRASFADYEGTTLRLSWCVAAGNSIFWKRLRVKRFGEALLGESGAVWEGEGGGGGGERRRGRMSQGIRIISLRRFDS
jgi:hypothetical protein